MKTTSFKFFILYFLFLTLSDLGLSQTNILPVPLIGQKSSEMCWAASLQMTIKYFDPSYMISQCDLANELGKINLKNDPFDYGGNFVDCSGICTDPCDYFTIHDCNNPLKFPNRIYAGSGKYSHRPDPSFFSMILSNEKFYSMEDINGIKWDQFKYEIDNCRPVILTYNAAGYLTGADEHAVVARGYDKVQTDYFVYINDPWGVNCNNYKEIYLNSELLNGFSDFAIDDLSTQQRLGRIHVILSAIHHISPKVNECSSCDLIKKQPNEPEGELPEAIKRISENFVAKRAEGIFNRSILEEVKESHQLIPLKYFNSEAVRSKKVPRTLRPTTYPNDMVEAIYQNNGTILKGVLRCFNEQKCIVERIEFGSIEKDIEVIIPKNGGQEIILSNSSRNESNLLNYTKVIFEEHPGEYRVFDFEGQTYITPTDEFAKKLFYGQINLEKNIAVPENQALDILREFVITYPFREISSEKARNRLRKKINKDGLLKMKKYLRKYKSLQIKNK